MKYFVLWTVLVLASKNESDADESVDASSGENIMENAAENPIVVKIEEDDYVKKRTSNYFGVSYNGRKSKWAAARWSKSQRKILHNGTYKDEKTAAHATDTLARKLIADGEHHKLNFPGDDTEVYPEEKTKHSIYFGVSYNENLKKWAALRWSKDEKKTVNNAYYRDEETAAHASDTLARKLMANGEQNHKLNFPDDKTEVYSKKTQHSKYFGVSYNDKVKRWIAQRRSKKKQTMVYNGYHREEEKAAHASDSLARKLMANGEHHHKLNFPDDNTEVHNKQYNKRKRSLDFEYSQTDGNNLEKFEE